MEDVALTSSMLENVKIDSLINTLDNTTNNFLNNNNSFNNNSNSNNLINSQIDRKNKTISIEYIDLDAMSDSKMQLNRSQSILNNTNTNNSSSSNNVKSNITTVTETSNNKTIRNSSTTQSPNTTTSKNNNNNANNTSQSQIEQNAESNTNNSKQVESRVDVKKKAKITSRIVFLKVGQVDTRNERFEAEAFIECSWEDDNIFKILSDPNMAKNIHVPNALEFMLKQAETATLNTNNLVNLKNIINNISVLEYDPNVFWSPQLYIENAIGELKEEIRHKLEIVEKEGSNLLDDPNFNPKTGQIKELINNLTVRVYELRKLRGVFYERLELYDFPMDMQELSITLTSKRNMNEIEIVENQSDPCSINTADFLDQQEWDLFNHVKTSQRTIYDPWRKYDRTGFSVSCYIARKPGYYLYNAYMLVFLITILGFVPFAFDSAGPQFRCQVTGLLLLTSVNFRWVVTQRLPSVPYLTQFDKYAISSLLYLVLFCVWHSVIGSNIITSDSELRKKIDSYVLIGSAASYILYILFYVLWFLRMFKSTRKFQNDGLKEAAIQAQKRDVLKKQNEQKHTLNQNLTATKNNSNTDQNQTNHNNGTHRPPMSQSMRMKRVNSSQTDHVRSRVASQPNTSDPSFLLNA